MFVMFLIGATTYSTTFAQNYKAPKIDASGKVTDRMNTYIGSVTKEGVITDAKGVKIAYIDADGMLVDSKGHKMGKAEKNGNFLPYFNETPEKGAWTTGAPQNGTCYVKDADGKVMAIVHENYKMFGACAAHCLQNHMKHGEVMDKSKMPAAYSCPMHPKHKSDNLAKCPECGMDMTK